jgi:hypothetical protein
VERNNQNLQSWGTLMQMKPAPIVLLLGMLAAGYAANAQQTTSLPSIMMANNRTFLAGQITISKDLAPLLHALDNSIFTCTLVQPLKSGDVVAAMTSEDQAWSADKTRIGTDTVAYPILAMVKTSDGGFHSLFPAVLKVNVDVAAGAILHSGTHEIKTTRAIKAGDSIPVLFIDGQSILSVGAADGTTKDSEAQPWFAVFEGDLKPDGRTAIVGAWRVEKDYVKSPLL